MPHASNNVANDQSELVHKLQQQILSLQKQLLKDAATTTDSDTDYNEEEQEDIVMKEVPDKQERSKGKIYVKSATTKPDNSRVYDKTLACFICNKTFRHRITEHLRRDHLNNNEVKEVFMQTGVEKSKNIDRLKHLGNYRHNVRVIEKGEGEIIVARRSPTPTDYKEYLPCIHCLGFFKTKDLWRHSRECPQKTTDKSERSLVTSSRLFLSASVSTAPINIKLESVLTCMHKDEVFQLIRNDKLIMKFGSILIQKLGKRRKNDISQRMRQLGRLKCVLCSGDGTKQLADYITAGSFDDIIEAVQVCAGSKENVDDVSVFTIPSLALRLGHSLLKCAQIKKGVGIRKDDDKTVKDAKAFEDLYAVEWNDRVSAAALASLQTNNYNNPERLPQTKDLVKLKQFLLNNITRVITQINAEGCSFDQWHKLATYTMARLILFNKRRSSEIAKLTTSTFTILPNWAVTGNEELLRSLDPLEHHLLNRLDMVQVRGKRNRRVPIVLTPDMTSAVHTVIEQREKAGIPDDNKYVFATRGEGTINAWTVLHECAKEAGCANPELVSATRLRKYVSTISQVSIKHQPFIF